MASMSSLSTLRTSSFGSLARSRSRALGPLALALVAGCAQDGSNGEPVASAGRALVYAPTQQTQDGLSFACGTGDPVTVTDATGAALPPGTVVTGAEVRDVVLENGIVRVTYELMDQLGASPPTRELGAHMLYRKSTGTPPVYVPALSSLYGDWTYFVAPFQQGAVEAHVLTNNGDVAEVAFVFEHALDYPGSQDSYGYQPSWWSGPAGCTLASGCGCYLPGCGVPERDLAGVAVRVAPYCDQPACFRRVRSVKLVKTLRLERCAEGYFIGYHSDPVLNPKNGLDGNNESSWGERELGTGSYNAVTWSSAGNVFRHPGQSQHGWMGIDDPTYMGVPAGQYPAFPAEQEEGPWWVADLPYFNHEDEIPFVRYLVMEHRLETGVWAFSTGQLGSTVVHFVNSETEADGMPTRYQVFVGAMPYVSPCETACAIPGLSGTWRCFPDEPLPSTTADIESRIPLTWPN